MWRYTTKRVFTEYSLFSHRVVDEAICLPKSNDYSQSGRYSYDVSGVLRHTKAPGNLQFGRWSYYFRRRNYRIYWRRQSWCHNASHDWNVFACNRVFYFYALAPPGIASAAEWSKLSRPTDRGTESSCADWAIRRLTNELRRRYLSRYYRLKRDKWHIWA